MTLKPLPPVLTLCAALCAPMPQASAATLAGMTNAKGYGTTQIHLQSASLVTVQFLAGLPDATLSIYNAAGQHLLTNDDQFGPNLPLDLDPRFSLDLQAGDYTLLVSYCCTLLGHLAGTGIEIKSTDGYNFGDYYLGGSSTLASMKAHLDGIEWLDLQQGSPFRLEVDGAGVQAHVPEPTSLLLAGAALALIGRRRRQAC